MHQNNGVRPQRETEEASWLDIEWTREFLSEIQEVVRVTGLEDGRIDLGLHQWGVAKVSFTTTHSYSIPAAHRRDVGAGFDWRAVVRRRRRLMAGGQDRPDPYPDNDPDLGVLRVGAPGTPDATVAFAPSDVLNLIYMVARQYLSDCGIEYGEISLSVVDGTVALVAATSRVKDPEKNIRELAAVLFGGQRRRTK